MIAKLVYRYKFRPGDVVDLDAEMTTQVLAEQRNRLHHEEGKLGGRASNLTVGIISEIFTEFHKLLFANEQYKKRFGRDGLRAWNAARSQVVHKMRSRHNLSERTAARWVTKTLGAAQRKKT